MRRDWTVPVIVGVVVLLGICVMGSIAVYAGLRVHRKPVAAASPPPPLPAPSTAPQDCLIGDWVEVAFTGNAEIYGTSVQLSGKGTRIRFAPNGTETQVLDNVVVSGDAQGSHYEVIHNGSLVMHFLADATTINYSDPQTTGSTTWKVDGKQTDQEPMHATLKPDTYRCHGNELRLYGDGTASELQRVQGLGTVT